MVNSTPSSNAERRCAIGCMTSPKVSAAFPLSASKTPAAGANDVTALDPQGVSVVLSRDLRCRLHLHRDPGFRTESDEVIERQLVHFISRDFGDARLRHAQTLGSLGLCDPFPIDPVAQSLRQF